MKRNKINFQLSDMKLDELWLKTRRGVLYALYLIGALLVQNVIFASSFPVHQDLFQK